MPDVIWYQLLCQGSGAKVPRSRWSMRPEACRSRAAQMHPRINHRTSACKLQHGPHETLNIGIGQRPFAPWELVFFFFSLSQARMTGHLTVGLLQSPFSLSLVRLDASQSASCH